MQNKLEEVALSLIRAVGGITDEANIKGVVEVFEGIRKGVHGVWEEHLAKQTEDLLMYDEILCECGRLIEVARHRDCVYATLYQQV